jgi:hypothetical protein
MNRLRPILALSLLFSLPGSLVQAKAPVKENVKGIYERHKKTNPKSCETLYYEIFSQGVDKGWKLKEKFKGDSIYEKWKWSDVREKATPARVLQRENELAYLLRDVKRLYLSEALPRMLSMSKPSEKGLIEEWKRRVQFTDLRLDDEYPDEVSMDLHGDLGDTNTLLLWNKSELQSNLLAPQVTCNESQEFLGTNLTGSNIKRRETPPIIYWGRNRLMGVESRAANSFTLGHELSHTLDWAPANLVQCLEGQLDAPDREAARRLKKAGVVLFEGEVTESKSSTTPEILLSPRDRSFEGVTHGAGTEQAGAFLKLGDLSPIKGGLDLDGLPQLSENLKGQRNREAVGDYLGIEVATKFIEGNYKTTEDRRQAARAILFFWNPLLLNEQDSIRMNYLGSKRTNESRVFRILLANKRFRSLLGCELQNPVKECP